MRNYKIKPGVKPYSGRILEARSEDAESVTGHVRLSRARYATAQRTYRLDELELQEPARGEP